MKWIIASEAFVFIVAQLLRYLTLAQNDNYILRLSSRRFRMTFLLVLIISAAACVPFYVFPMVSYGIGSIYLWVRIFASNKKIKFTRRFSAYLICSTIISVVFCYVPCVIADRIFFSIVEGVVSCSAFLFVLLPSFFLNKYYEKKNDRFIRSVSENFSKSKTKIIAITGSFGKTSCKNILYTILSEKYNVAMTGGNYNTPMGVALSMQKLTGQEDFFIAEFGARREGDIKKLCSFFQPDVGIVTGVCKQHSEVFGSIHTIYNEKFNLPKMTKKEGFCAFGNNLYAKKMLREFDGNKISVGACEDIYLQNVVKKVGKTSFKLHIHSESYSVTTSLIGKQALENILLCVAVADKLGVSGDKIAKALSCLKQIPHRLEYSYANGIHILDDSYNGNPIGVRCALDCLKTYPSPKFVVAQGVVELGINQKWENIFIGREISKVADVVFLLGVNKRYIRRGLEDEKFSGTVYNCRNLKQVTKIMKKKVRPGSTVLFQNDVPDIY